MHANLLLVLSLVPCTKPLGTTPLGHPGTYLAIMTNASSYVYSLDDVVIGASYVIVSILFSLIYIPCLIVMRTDSQLKQHSCLRVMFHLGISDMLQFIGQIITGIWSMTGYAFTVTQWVNNLTVNLTLNIAWNAYIPLTNLLALNRAVLFASSKWQTILFSPKGTTIWISVCWAWAGAWLMLNLSPWFGMVYYGDIWTYYFDAAGPFFELHKRLSLINCIVHQSCIWVFNLISIFTMKKQALIICLVLFVMDQYWHNVVEWLCPTVGIYCYPIGNYLLMLNSAINPVLYLIFNKKIRRKVFRMIGLMNRGNAAATSTKQSASKRTKQAWPAKTEYY